MPTNGRQDQGNAMIYELRTYTVKPGTTGDMVKAASTVSLEIRKDDYGKLEGYWWTDIGPLNQVMHLWSYPDLNERSRLRGELARNPRWTGEYVPLIRPLILRQDVRLLIFGCRAQFLVFKQLVISRHSGQLVLDGGVFG